MRLLAIRHKKVTILFKERQDDWFRLCWLSICILPLQNSQYSTISHSIFRSPAVNSPRIGQNASISIYRSEEFVIWWWSWSQKWSKLGYFSYFIKPTRSGHFMQAGDNDKDSCIFPKILRSLNKRRGIFLDLLTWEL